MQYDDVILEASDAEIVRTDDKRRSGKFNVRVLKSPAGEMTPEQVIPVEYDHKALQTTLLRLEKRYLDRAGLIALGRVLALLLLPPRREGDTVGIRELFATSLAQVGQDRGLRLRLRLPPFLSALPWEYIYVDRAGSGEGMDGFLALDPRVAIIRHEPLPAPAALPQVRGNIKVVIALASATGLPPLDLAAEKANLEQAFGTMAGLDSILLEDATLDEVQVAIPNAGIFHFAGHGVFAREMGELPGIYTGTGALALDDQQVEAEELGINLRGNGVRLAVLSGCETGRRDGVNVWSGIAPVLAKAGIPAVVAHQYSILDKSAIAFGRQFYQALVGGLPVERAMVAGRIAAYNADPQGRDWGVPVLYLRAENGQIFGGAADEEVRQQAQETAEVDVSIRVREVAAGGEVLGAEVLKMLAGRLAVRVVVNGIVYGKVVGATFEQLGGGKTEVDMDIDKVDQGGSVTGIKIDQLG